MKPEELCVLHIDDEGHVREHVARELCEKLGISPENLLQCGSVNGALAIIQRKAEAREHIHLIICNGKINFNEGDAMPTISNGCDMILARYMKMRIGEESARERIGAPAVIHNTGSVDGEEILERLRDICGDVAAYVMKIVGLSEENAIAVAAALVLAKRGLEADQIIAWAKRTLAEDTEGNLHITFAQEQV